MHGTNFLNKIPTQFVEMASFQKLCGFEVHLFSLYSDAHMMMLERTLVLTNSGKNKKERLLAS